MISPARGRGVPPNPSYRFSRRPTPTSTPKTLHPRHGAVDARALEALRQELLTLHGMALALIIGGDSRGATAPEAIRELAEDLESELADCIARLESAATTREELVTLAP